MNPFEDKRPRLLLMTIVAWSVVLVIISPMFWMVLSSLKPQQEVISVPPTLLPSTIDFGSYRKLFSGDFLLWFANSIIVAAGTMAIVLTIGTLGAYSLTRFRYRGRRGLALLVLFTYLFPSVLMLVPLFVIISRIGLSDTFLALMIANTTFALPFAMWLLRSYFLSIPVQVEEAAMVDGASRLRAFVEIVLPQVSPGLISTAIFTFILAWDDYLFASIFISSSQKKTLPVGIARYANELSADWGVLMAASVSVTVPVLILFAFMQARLLPDLSAGAVKS